MATKTDTDTAEAEAKPTTITPSALAKELDVDPKRLRAYLRRNHTRPDEALRSRWEISEEIANAAREAFAPKSDDSDES